MIGSRISHFRIDAKIAEGGMGVVYKAEDLDLGRAVAIKVLPPHLVADEDRRQRFLSEARTAAAVTHPNIATIHEIGRVDDVIFIAMECVEGQTLRKLIAEKPLPMKEAIRIATEIAEGLAAAHQAKIAHRDLKPDNIMIGMDGRVKILDFGLARLLTEGQREEAAAETPTTSVTPEEVPEKSVTGAVTLPVGDGKVLGTPAYMSPEQARGQYLDFRTDIFSFGSTLYEMVTGRPPFQGRTSTGTINEILNKDPIPVNSLNPETPSSIQWILDKCLEKDPSRRYQDTRDLVVDLRHVYPDTGPQTVPDDLSHGSWSAPARRADPSSRLRLPLLLGAAVVVGALGLLGLQWNRSDQLPPPNTEENSLAIFPFENLKHTDDPERLGQILQELLITDLSGLDPLKVFSSQRLSDIEQQVLRSDRANRERGLANSVAEQAGAQTMLTGSLSQLGDKWILTAQLSDVSNGTVLKSKRLDGEDLYAMVDQLTDEIQLEFSIKLPGEMARIARKPVKEKTSASMEAIKHYLNGIENLDNNSFNEAVLELTRAVEIDPSFGKAYYHLAIATWWLYSDAGAGKEQMQKLIDNELYTSSKEKRMAEAMLLVIDYKWSEAIPALEQLTKEYPDEKLIWYALGEAQFHAPAGDKRSKSLVAFEKAAALDPDFLLPYRHIFDVLHFEQRYEEAVARADQLIELDPDNPVFQRYRVTSIAILGDESATEKALAEALPHTRTAEDRRELYNAVGIQLGFLRDVSAAEAYLRKALEADPGQDDPHVLRMLLTYLWEQHKIDEVEKYTRQQLESDPDNDTYIENMFRVYMAKAQYAEAHGMARELVEKDSEDPRWNRRWAQCTVYAGDEEATREAIEHALSHNSSNDDRRMLYGDVGWAYARMGNFNTARDHFKKALEVDPEGSYSSELTAIGFQDRMSGRFDEAEKWFRKAQEQNPRNFEVHVALAQIDMERGDFQAAIDELEEGMKLLPPSQLFPFMTASLQVLNGDLEQAEALFTQMQSGKAAETQVWNALVNGPHDFPMGLGWAYLLAGSPERAEEVFQRATEMEMSSRAPDAHDGLAWTHMFEGEYDEAEEHFSKALEIGYSHIEQYFGLAVLALLRGDYDDAEHHVQQALEEGPASHAALSRLLARIYAEQGRFEEARELAEKVVAMDSTRASQEFLSWVLIAGDLDVERGVNIAKLALERPAPFSDFESRLPYRASLEHCLGLAYLKLGDHTQALTHLRKAADLQPDRRSIQADLRRALQQTSGTE